MRTLRFIPALGLLVAASAALAQPAGPPAPHPMRPVPPPPAPIPAVEIVRGTGPAAAVVQAHVDAVAACMPATRHTPVRARVALRWDRHGRLVDITLTGGPAAFDRCASRALRGTIPATQRGHDLALILVQPRAAAPITPPGGSVDLQACTADGECTLFYREHGCVAGDPVAVNAAHLDLAPQKYPVRRLECAMGGPQYEQLRMNAEARYSTRCEQHRCTVHDAGPDAGKLPAF
jgi:YD repeat-containing protein